MSSLLQDLRFALRVIRKNPVTSAVIVATLGLGIGGNTGMFAAFDAWVLRPLDFSDPESLVVLGATLSQQPEDRYGVSAPDLRDWREQSASFEEVAAYRRRVFDLDSADDPERVEGARVEASLFPLLGKNPFRGRHFTPREDVPGGPDVALISHQLWERRFDSDAGVVGRTLRLDGRIHEVVGVMPPGFEFPEWAHVWTPLALDPGAGDRNRRRLSTVARLRPGVGLEDARTELRTIAEGIADLHPETNAGWSATVQPLREQWAPPVIGLAITVSVVIASFVLLVICANVANLMLAQASGRQREMALRTALGASRRRLIRQSLTESLILAAAGGALGALIGGWWVDWMVSWAPLDPPYLFRMAADGRALLYTLAVSLVAGVLCALAPLVRGSGLDLAQTLKSAGARNTGGRGGRRLRGALVVGELAVSMLLVIASLLMVKSFIREQSIEPGFRTADVLTLQLSLRGEAYRDEAARVAFLDRALTAVSGLAEVESAGAADYLPVSPNGFVTARLDAESRPAEPGEEPLATVSAVTRGYLETLEIAVVEGRSFTAGELSDGGGVALVSQTLAKRLWPRSAVLERRIRYQDEPGSEWLRVVGVVTDVDPGRSMTERGRLKLQLYVPYAASPAPAVTLAVASAAPLPALAPAVRDRLRSLDPRLPVSEIRTMRQTIDHVHWVSRMFSQLFLLYAAVALAIAALGAYGMIADLVSQRLREMGVRLALGARPADLLRLIVGRGLALGAAGVVLGILGAIPLTRVLASMLYQVSATDPAVFAGVALLLLAVTAVAAYLPARRAARVDPMRVLHFE